MFTGIIQSIGMIQEYRAKAGDARLRIEGGGLDFSDVAVGDSISVNGVPMQQSLCGAIGKDPAALYICP